MERLLLWYLEVTSLDIFWYV